MKKRRRLLSLMLCMVMGLSMAAPAYAAPESTVPMAAEETAANPLSLDNVVSIQAITEGTYYGTGVTSVVVTYKDGVDVSGAKAENYSLTDRGSLTADFGAVDIADVTVEGQVVTLHILRDSDATEANKMVYTGDNKEGARQRDSYGVYVTGAWYRDAEGVIHNGAGSEEKGYVANETKMGYQVRECLELKLQVAGEDAVECLADDKGQYNAEGKWLETIDTQFGEGAFQDLTGLKIESTAVGADWEGTGSAADDYVRGYYYVPENYDPANGIVFTLQGQGISYWKLPDGTDNAGTGTMFDCATTSWANKDAIVVNIHDRSSQQTLAEDYDFVVDDANVMKYFIDTYKVTGNIVIQGNSRGTMASDIVIKALAGCAYNPKEQAMGWNGEKTKKLDKSVYDFDIDAYICQNGSMGGTYWPGEDLTTIAETGLKVWAFDGEQDSNNIDTIAAYKEACAEVGFSDEWIAENVRLTGLASELTCFWGESDHSATRTNGWYFANAAYYGSDLHIDENGAIVYDTKLQNGEKYVLKGRGTAATNNKAGYEYTVYDELHQVWALKPFAQTPAFEATELTTVAPPAYERTDDPNQLPLTGYFKADLAAVAGREVRFYIPETAILRPYFHFIAVPSGVDVDEFVVSSGWKQIADETGECLWILVPDQATGVWGDVADEVAYISAAKNFHGSNGGYFTTFGEFYLTGYGDGAKGLEAWAAVNPNLVIAQTYIAGESAGVDTLAASGEEFFGYKHMTDGDVRDRDGDGYNERVDENGNQKIMYQFTDRLKTVVNPDAGENAGLLKKADFPVPTILVNAADSAAYWQTVNKAPEADEKITSLQGIAVEGTVNNQKAATWATEYAGNISKVVNVKTAVDTNGYEFARAIRDEMAYYTRYDNTVSYGNGLMLRLDYTKAQHDRYTSAEKYGEQEVCGLTLDGVAVKGTVSIQELVASDGYYSDLLMYVPETAAEKNVPVIVVWHGGSQNGHLFMDSTSWWQTAAKEGFAIVFPTRTYKATDVSHDELLWDGTLDILKKDGRFDMTRIYTSGQSMGGVTTTTIEMYRPKDLAAGVATNAGNVEPDLVLDCGVPAGLVIGEGNYALRGIPGYEADCSYEDDHTTQLTRSTEAAKAGADIYWDYAMSEGRGRMVVWEKFFETMNGVSRASIRDEILFRGASELNQGTNGLFTIADWNTNNARLRTWYWDNNAGIPVMMYTMAMYQAHNCQPSYRPVIWDFVKHYSVVKNEDGSVTRYYSESAFAEDDAVVITRDGEEDLQSKIVDIKATVAPNFYGHKVCQAVITFEEDTNPSFIMAADINVWDRGSANPNFGTLKVVDKKVEGNVVTLTFNTDSDKTADRARNSFGMMNTTGWYQDSEGNIYFGSADSVDNMGNKIYANKNNKTCQPRTPELRVTVNTELKDSVAPKCELEITGGLEKIQTILVPVSAFQGGFSQVTDKEEVPVQVIFPDNYDKTKKYPAIVYQCGGGVNYWQLDAGVQNNIAPANNLGCNTVYDNTMTQWHKAMPEAIIMAVNVQSAPTEVSARQICDAIEYAAANWGVEIGKVVMSGNSQGTIIGSDAIRQRPDLFAAFIECNGNFGAMIGTPAGQDGTVENSSFKNWTAAEVANMIDNDVACWMFNGETDGANPGVAQDTYETLANLYAAKGYSAEWIFNNIRVSGLQSWKFKAYGETDHSVTKVVADQYVLNPYYDVYENATMKPGQKYKFTGKEDYNFYEYTMDFDYTVYEESVSEWVQNLFAGKYAEEIKAPAKKTQTIVTAANTSAITKVYGDKAFKLGAKTTGDGKLTYKSDNTKVAKVDKNGKVTIKGTGKAVITITAAATETCKKATLKVTIKVLPKKGAVASAKVSKKNLTVKAKKDAKATGYQIQVSSSVNFAKKNTCTYTGKKVSTTVKNLKAGTYYVRTRSYKTVGSKKYYGAYSAVKVVKVK